jgi:hypothetical protein
MAKFLVEPARERYKIGKPNYKEMENWQTQEKSWSPEPLEMWQVY